MSNDAEERRKRQREYQREWRKKNPNKVRQYAEREASEARKEYRRRYYQQNREKILKRTAKRYQADPALRELKKERARKWAEQHPKELRERQRRHWAKKKYGLTLEEAEAILARGCAICGVKEDPQRGDRRHGRLCIDHNHVNGKVRAALCHSCNAALGGFGDDPTRLRAAADYLEEHT